MLSSALNLEAVTAHLARTIMFVADVVIPKRSMVVIRTFPDFDDQGLELVTALVRRGRHVVWLTDRPDRTPARLVQLNIKVVRARSAAGMFSYLRAQVVAHTHGVYASPRASRRKLLVNLWHGMPVKRLNRRPAVARHQTDILAVTSRLHADNFVSDWGIPDSACRVVGLPRNDVLQRGGCDVRLPWADGDSHDMPLVVWMPTFRQSIVGDIRSDGTEWGNVFQLPGATMSAVSREAKRVGVRLVVKLHPMAPLPDGPASEGNVSVWTEHDLASRNVSLYQLLAAADALITDHSSVWIDYLLLQRPIVFSISDLEAYASSRGHYFVPLTPSLPGPVASSVTGVFDALGSLLGGGEDAANWGVRRRQLLGIHHEHQDAASSERVAALIDDFMGVTAGRTGTRIGRPTS
jgi:CDP-glycerol glycerophosphotransferase